MGEPAHRFSTDTGKVSLAYPPPFQDRQTLTKHLCISETTIDDYVAAGLLPRPRKGKGTPLWEWADVVTFIRGWPVAGPGLAKADSAAEAPGQEPDAQTTRVRLAAERASRGTAP